MWEISPGLTVQRLHLGFLGNIFAVAMAFIVPIKGLTDDGLWHQKY